MTMEQELQKVTDLAVTVNIASLYDIVDFFTAQLVCWQCLQRLQKKMML